VELFYDTTGQLELADFSPPPGAQFTSNMKHTAKRAPLSPAAAGPSRQRAPATSASLPTELASQWAAAAHAQPVATPTCTISQRATQRYHAVPVRAH